MTSHPPGDPRQTQGDLRLQHRRNRRSLTWALAITIAVLLVEVAGGILSGSLALLADAGHMVSDVGALGLSLFAFWYAARPATARKTFGFHRVEILAALANGATLMIVAGLIFAEAYRRVSEPRQVESGLMLVVAIIGLAANLAAAVTLSSGRRANLNMRGAFLHVLGDLAGSVATVLAAGIILLTGWTPADPIASAAIGVLIVIGGWRLMKESANVLLEGTPRGLDYAHVMDAIRAVPGVADLHDLHVWSITSGFPVLTSHVVVGEGSDPARVLKGLQTTLEDRFGITHATLQLETRAYTQTWVCDGEHCYPVGSPEGAYHSP